MDKVTKKEYDKAYRKRNKEIILERKRKWFKDNPEKRKSYNDNWVEKNFARYLWISAKGRAKRDNKDFDLNTEDVIIPEVCPILGIPLTRRSRGEGRVKSNASIDRIDNTKGYTKDNVQVVSWLANTMKSSATPEELVAFAKGILKIYGEDS